MSRNSHTTKRSSAFLTAAYVVILAAAFAYPLGVLINA